MTGGLVACEENSQRRTKVKTGCVTCRIRKVKCDENKPFCQKCVGTGRTCDGYNSRFRLFVGQPIKDASPSSIKSIIGGQPILPTFVEIAAQDVELLSRYFSTKTIFDVKLDCDEEARQVLRASLSDSSVRHALLSLKLLREDLEISGDGPTSVAQQTTSYHYGLQQYNMALGGLASNLSSLGSNALKSALFCCQLFISIEQVRKNYAAMAQHIIRGMSIMHEYRARPGFVAANILAPAHHDQLPFLDVFIIKLFAAPCKFADRPTESDRSRTEFSACMMSPHQNLLESHDFRAIAPNMRTELTRIATLTLEFLAKVSQVESVEIASRLLLTKAALLDSLKSWIDDLELLQINAGSPGHEPVSVSFLRMFHLILKIILLRALDSSPGLYEQLQTEDGCLQNLANSLGIRVSAYVTCNGTGSNRGQRSATR